MKQKSRKRTWTAAIVIAFVTAGLLVLPYVIGHLNAAEGTVFTGLLVNLEDGTYLSAIEQGRSGAWLYRSHFTVESHEPVFLEGFYLALGQVGRLLNLSTVVMWHLGQFTANLILFLTIFAFTSLFLESNRQRFTAYLLALFGAGFDWWQFPAWFERAAAFEVVPIDLRFPEAHIFYSALTFPHFVAGITLILLALGLTYYALTRPIENKKRWLLAVGAGMANLLLGVVYPYLIYLTAVILAAFYLYLLMGRVRNDRLAGEGVSWGSVLDWTEIGLLAIVFGIPLPLYIYYAIVFLNNPVLQIWNEQAYTPSPNPVHYLLTYGLYLFLAVLYPLKRRGGSGQEVNDERNQSQFRLGLVFLWIWLGAAAVLLYAPLNSQRRFVEGLQVPLSILAVVGFYQVAWPWFRNSRLMQGLLKRPRYSAAGMQRLVVLSLIGLAGLGNVYLYSSTLLELGLNQPFPLFRPQSEFEAMAWLEEHLEPGQIVLASYRTGSFLPYRTGATVVVGNQYETNNFSEKSREVRQFFGPESTDDWRRELLAGYDISYIFLGPEERRLGGDQMVIGDYLEISYQNEGVIIYKVQGLSASDE